MAKKVKKIYINEMGQSVPAKYTSDYDKLRDEIIERIISDIQMLVRC